MKLWILFKLSLSAAFFSDITSAGDEAGTALYCQMGTEDRVSYYSRVRVVPPGWEEKEWLIIALHMDSTDTPE